MKRVRLVVAVIAFLIYLAGVARGQSIATADLQIQGAGLRVVNVSVTTGLDMPASIQTEFGGKQNDQAPIVEGLVAAGELDGPGIEIPIRLETAPGHKFAIPALSREGVYFLRNVRLLNRGEFLQPATPSVATITVSNLLRTSVKVRQLTPDELRARGITLDARNYEVFEYTFSFFIDGQTVEIPFPVVINTQTREVRELAAETPYTLPPIGNAPSPPRWNPPAVYGFELGPAPNAPPLSSESPQGPSSTSTSRPSIPAALVIPNNLAVLHQFFAVTLMVTNGAPAGSSVVLDSVTALIRTPAEVRVAKSIPAAAFNQPVPIVDATTGVTFLVAQSKGEAEWTVEGLEPGTHTLEVDVRATYKSPGQTDFPLSGVARASVVVHDPRFNITFSHPDTVRKGIDYTTYSFITNMSAVTQTVRVGNVLPACAQSPGANVCRRQGTPEVHELTIPAGEMRMIEYELTPSVTGRVFASAGSVSDGAVSAAVQLFMGVSESGIPLSPATLVMPHYARYVSQDLVEAYLPILGLGYSLATAPLTQALAQHPRVIRTDVFQRATDIARAGQRLFIGESPQDALSHMALDLLGNGVELREWDELRRREKTARAAGSAVIRELEKNATGIGAFVDRFASKTAHRGGYLLALLHGSGEMSIRGAVSGRRLERANEAPSGWVRDLAFGDLSRFQTNGELALVGRWTEKIELRITPAATGAMSLELIHPATNDGTLLRTHLDVQATSGKVLSVEIDRGQTMVHMRDELGAIVTTANAATIAPEPLAILAARQDLHLDSEAHKVSVLFNRPAPATENWLPKFHGRVVLKRDGVDYNGARPISAAVLQADARIVNVTFDHALSRNATYTINVDGFAQPITPVIDNDRPAGILFGRVLKADNTPIANAEITLTAGAPQYDLSLADGSFLFEYVPRDIDNGLDGSYSMQAVTTEGKHTSVAGAVRLPGRVHFVNLVFLGRGSAEGWVRYESGEVVKGARVVVGSTMFDQFRQTTTDAAGFYRVADLPVGPLTFSATDASGNVTFGAAEIKTPGEVVTKDLSIVRRPFPGTGTIRGIVKRSDTQAAVPGARVGVYSQGYGLVDALTDSAGRFELTRVPAGFIRVLAAEWTISRESVALDFDLAADQTRDLTITLGVTPAVSLVTVEGDVVRENPLFPGDASKYQKVSGAVVKIDGGQAVTADPNGHFVIESVPQTWSGRSIQAYDPLTTRSATTLLPALDPSRVNVVPLFISAASGFGEGTVRVRVFDAAGRPANELRVITTDFPSVVLTAAGNGVYELAKVKVGSAIGVVAISQGGRYGNQFASGTARVEFHGHVASLALRLGGQGTVRVKLRSDIDLIGDVAISFPVWDESKQDIGTKSITQNTAKNGIADFAVFENVPALHGFSVSSQHPVHGYAAQNGKLAFDGDLQMITLQLDNKLSTVRGVVYGIDGRIPIAGASVRMEDGRQNQGVFTTLPDGSFTFFNVPSGTAFRVVAEVTQAGIHRTGFALGKTPPAGGPVEDVAVILRAQGSVEGRIVYSAYKTFDPQNPANNVPDPTPNDLSDNAPVPLARFTLRELDFPSRSFGTTTDPLRADALGRFSLSNLFVGPLRATASDPNNQELRGTWIGTLTQEGETLTAFIGVGGTGFGSLAVTVVDPNQQNAPVANAEVSLFRGGLFDFATTDAAGRVLFDQIPAGTYSAAAFSKVHGRSGSSGTITVGADIGASARIVLQFSGKVTGKLSDPEAGGRGVPGAHVTLSSFNHATRASTDVSGSFLFEGVREGLLHFSAKDTLTNRRANASRTLSQADPEPFVPLELEPTETLHVSVYEPNDSGAMSNVLVPVVTLDVAQRCPPCEFARSLQGNAFQVAGLFRLSPYSVVVREVGGAERVVSTSASFPKGSSSDPLKIVLPAYGTVEVRVVQGAAPVANARVTVVGGGRSATIFTDATGLAIATGIGLGNVSVQAVTLDGLSSGSATATLNSQSTPAAVTITLGTGGGFAGITGMVEAEKGGPSAGTRVVASFGRLLEMFTDSTGRFTFQGIPTGSTVSLTYIGPDDVTVGARQSVVLRPEDASKTIAVPGVKLDATPPQLLSFFPADGAQSVSPDTSLRFVFSEPIAASQINSTFIQLIPADKTTPVAGTYTSSTEADGTFVVRMTPPPPAAGKPFPLESHTLYRIIVSGEIRDLTGNKLPATRGAAFTTSDYKEPSVIKVTPATTTPLQPATTFQFTFNEPVDAGAVQLRFFKLNAPGPTGAVVAELPGRTFLDPATSLTLHFAPNDRIEAQSFYRIVFSGIRDLQGNAASEQTFHFFSFDSIKPFVIPVSPVPASFPLISGVEYTLKVDLRNGDANGQPATDIARVDFFRMDGATPAFVFGATKAPFSYRFVAPDVPDGSATLALRIEATDFSGNVSDAATISWSIQSNKPPQNVAITLTPATSIYAGNRVRAAVAFEDEGILATVQLEATGTRSDGSAYLKSLVAQAMRATVDAPWSATTFDVDLPPTLKEGSNVTFTATVTDSRGQKTASTASLAILEDAIRPEVLGLTPVAETRFAIGNTYQIETIARDAESGIAKVVFNVDGQTVTVLAGAAGVTAGPQPGSWRFASGVITVPAKNIDTRIPITATAHDYHGNTRAQTVDVIYTGVNDPTLPKAAWLCPIDKAALPAGQTALPVDLQIRATDDIAITGVKFQIADAATPVTATRVGTSDVYQATATIATPAAGTPFAITAIVSDANPQHDVLLPISIELVAVDVFIDERIQAVTSTDVASYEGKSIAVRGATARLVPHVPLSLKNLLVLGGAKVETLPTTTTAERRLDLTVAERLYIDCISSIDVTARGYLGGWGLNADGSNTKNEDSRGRTVGNTSTGGPTTFASASHGGIGGEQQTGITNAVYGSIVDPIDLGTGGGGGTTCCSAGAPGGGAVKLRGGIFAIAGGIRADGGSLAGNGNAGSGGSINIGSRVLVTGPSARITANGGDDDAVNNASRGGGGGRIAVAATERLEVEKLGVQIAARGGRNNTTSEAPSHVDGGAGTIFVRRPSQTTGELFVGARDERFATSTHLTRSTPLGAALGGSLAFDRVELGPRALLRVDDPITIAGVVADRNAFVVDPTAVVMLPSDRPAITVTTTPAANSSLVQGSTLTATYTATSPAGIGAVTLAWTPVTPNRVDSHFSYPTNASAGSIALAVPHSATAGAATLVVSAKDRAGRSTDAAAVPFTIVANAPPAITKLDVVPLSLYPGKTVTSTVAAADDLSVTRLTFTSTIGNAAPSVQTRTPNAPVVTDQVFTVAVPIDTPGGAPMTVTAAAEDAFPGRTATTKTVAVTILTDANAPSLTVTSPQSSTLFQEGTGAKIPVRATAVDAEVAVKQIYAQIDGGPQIALIAGTGGAYSADIPVPSVDGVDIVTKKLAVTAKDYQGNAAVSPSIAIRIQPLVDPNAPVLSWTCSSSGAMVPAGSNAKLRVFAIGNDVGNAANGIQKVELFVDDSTTPIAATPVSGLANHYEAMLAIPAAADGTTVSVRAVATNTAGLSNDVSTLITIVTGSVISANTTIAATDASYDGKTVIVQSGTTTITGQHAFDRLVVLSGAKVTHAATDATTIHRLTFTAQSIYVACDASIDVSGLGFTGSTTGTGRTWPNSATGGSHNGAGGSHGGRGGAHDAHGDSAGAYGSVLDPNEPGGAGGLYSNGTCAACNPGGGIARIQASRFVLDGKVLANGVNTNSGGGAGGSIRLDVQTLSGAGEIRADGATGTHAGGGGGRVAIYSSSLALDRTKITAAGGLHTNNATRTGSAGTVYLSQLGGLDELVIDNVDRLSLKDTPLAILGTGTVTAVSGATLTLSAAVPEWIEGSWIELESSAYAIVSRTATTVTVAGTVNVATGAAYRGAWRFDQVTARRQGTLSAEALRTPIITTTATGLVRVRELHGDTVSLRGRVEANTLVSANELALQNGALLTHSPSTADTIHRLNVKVNTLTIDATSAIDVSGRGFSGAAAGYGRTWPNVTTGGSYNGAGGSHGGRGGAHDAIGDSGPAYGSLFDPTLPGAAGGYYSTGTCNPCNAGGGVARITAKTFTLNGKLLANGLNTNSGGGAGGSIRIDAESLTGTGEIRADGGPTIHAAGGGGRIALYYQSLGLDRSRISAAGGLHTSSATRTGAAGTIYLKRAAQPAGELLADNLGRATSKHTVLTSVGFATVTEAGSNFVKDANAQFAAPDFLAGIRLVLDNNRTTTWPITGNDAKTIRVDATVNAQVGQSIRGLYRFDNVTLRNARLEVLDLLESSTAIDKDATSQLLGSNLPPVLTAPLIALQSTATGSSVIGAAGAVSDPDAPITLTATNTASANTYATTANADGSFVIPVQGNAGDAITLKAKDANHFPLESPVLSVGTLAAGTPKPEQIDRSAWTTDTAFRARRIVSDDKLLFVHSNASDKLAILSINDPARPALVRTVTVANGGINDVAVTNGWAVIAANDLVMLDLSNTSSTPVILPDAAWYEYAVAIRNGYAFTSTNNGNDGRIRIYDVSNPASAHFVREQDMGIAGVTWESLAVYGNYLVASTSTRPNNVGHDVVLFDVTNLHAIVKVADLDIPSFDASSAVVAGSRLYVTSLTSKDLVIVDLTNPKTPAVLGRVTLAANTGGAGVIDTSAFVADGTAGLVEVRATNPAAPAVIGAIAVGGTACDVALASPFAYVANDVGLAVVPISTPPQIDATRISLAAEGTTAKITGAPRAILGTGTFTVGVKNVTTGATASAPVAADGSFTASVGGVTNDPITLEATDSAGRKSGPVSLGVVPFGSRVTSTPFTPSMSQLGYRARTIAIDGTHLIVGGYADSNSTSLIVYDVTDPAAPQYKRTVALGNGPINAVAIHNGWAVVAANDLVVLNLGSATSTPVVLPDASWYEYEVLIRDGYAFTTTNHGNDGRVRVYDVSTPASARYVSETDLGLAGVTFSGLAALGSRYLVASASIRPNNIGHDVVVIDRSNPYALVKVADLDIPSFDAFRGRILGTTLYLADMTRGVAVVDLADPKTPVVKTIVPLASARGIDIAGTTVAVANGGAGVTFLDASQPHAPVVFGTQPVGGWAWGVAFNRRNLYVANEQGLAVVSNLATAPLIDPSRVAIIPTSGTLATVAGSAYAVGGLAPLQIAVRNATSGATITGQTVATDGSFSAVIPAMVTETISVEATDAIGRKSGAVTVGQVPFGAAVTTHLTTPALTGESYRARTLATDGKHLILGGYNDSGSTRLIVYDCTDPAAPQYKRSVALNNGPIHNVAIHNGWAIVAANDLVVLDLGKPDSIPIVLPDANWFEYDVLVANGYAFTPTNNGNDGRIRIYDVSNPATARFVREQDMGLSGVTWSGLAALGPTHLIAFTAARPNNIGHDVVVFDRSNVYSLVKVADIDIPNFNAFRGKVVGTTLYLAGTTGGLAIVDVTDPKAPVVKTVMSTGGTPYGVDGSGALLAVADGGSGVTFLDIANPAAPRIIGTQPVGGTAWSLAFNRGNLYVANELGLAVIARVGAAPIVAASLVSITTDSAGNATVTGAAGAVSGTGALTVEVRNARSGQSVAGRSVAADGSFSVTLAAQPTDPITVEATDEVGRKSGRVLVGTVPFGTVTTIPITPAISEPGYRARTVATDGTHLVVGGNGDASSTKLVVFDVTDPGVPRHLRTVALGNGPINNVAVHAGWAVVAANDLVVLDLSKPDSTPVVLPDANWYEYGLLISGGYAFTATNNGNDGRIRIYDVANPGAAHYVREQDFGLSGVTFSGLAAVGSDFIVASTTARPNNIGHDVVVIDRRDINALAKVADVDIPGFDAIRGRAIGTTLYLAGLGGGVAVVDLSDPKQPVVKTILQTAGDAIGFDSTASTLAVADSTAGVTFLDVTDPLAPRSIGTQFAGGTVWDVEFSRGTLYAVNEQALVVVHNIAATPVVDRSLIRIATDSATSVTVSGAARSVTGVAPLSVSVKNATTNITSAASAVAADGSFSVSIAAAPNDALVMSATDNGGRIGTLSLGRSPFGTTTTQLAGAAQAANDASYRARRIASDGTATVVGSGSTANLTVAQSGQILVFRGGQAKSYDAGGGVNDIAIHNGYALIAANAFVSLNLADPNATPYIAPDASWFEYSVAVSGNYAFTSTNNGNDGRIRLYNIANPAQPVFFREQDMAFSGVTWEKLLALGTSHIVALAADKPNGVGHDVVVIDATNPSSLVKLADLDIPNFDTFDGVIDGTTLYVAGGDAGIAIVDLATPATPQVKAVLDTPGVARGISLSGTNEIAVADGSSGVTFIDTTNRQKPSIRGTQVLSSTNCVDVHVVGKNFYIASENYFHVISRPSSP